MTDEEKKQLEELQAKAQIETVEDVEIKNDDRMDEVALIDADDNVYRKELHRKELDNSDEARLAVAQIVKGVARMAVIAEQRPDFFNKDFDNVGDAVEAIVLIDEPVSDVISALYDVNPEEVASVLNVDLVMKVSDELANDKNTQTAIKKLTAQIKAQEQVKDVNTPNS